MAAKRIKILDDAPKVVNRPLALVDGRGYLITWVYAEIQTEEGKGKETKITNEWIPILLCDNGCVFEDIESATLKVQVRIPEMPPHDKLMSAKARKAYSNGYRPDPADVFKRVVDVVDYHIDFEKSLADQQTMAEMVGCYIFSTWFLPALNVVGYLWPNGDKGSGKTELLHCVAELSCLGMVILAGGSYATLRDMADCGATLCFDDAENTSDSKFDQDKKSLLLSGNRRGSVVSVKEQAPDKKWKTRYVNAFCPRAFSAIKLPDPVLESRTIVIPLVRTPNEDKANRESVDHDSWPHDRRELIDDLWALGLSRLVEFSTYPKIIGVVSRLSGRNLEPWKAILSVAYWLQDKGVSELWERMNSLSLNYQNERADLMTNDLTTRTIKALCQCASRASSATSASSNGIGAGVFRIETKQLTETVKEITRDEDEDPEKVTSEKVGRVLGRLGLEKCPRPGGRGPRAWQVSVTDLERLTKTYGLNDLYADITGSTGTTGPSGSDESVDNDSVPDDSVCEVITLNPEGAG